jgi:hypothetical protein
VQQRGDIRGFIARENIGDVVHETEHDFLLLQQ